MLKINELWELIYNIVDRRGKPIRVTITLDLGICNSVILEYKENDGAQILDGYLIH